jgi:hypothetical protein
MRYLLLSLLAISSLGAVTLNADDCHEKKKEKVEAAATEEAEAE